MRDLDSDLYRQFRCERMGLPIDTPNDVLKIHVYARAIKWYIEDCGHTTLKSYFEDIRRKRRNLDRTSTEEDIKEWTLRNVCGGDTGKYDDYLERMREARFLPPKAPLRDIEFYDFADGEYHGIYEYGCNEAYNAYIGWRCAIRGLKENSTAKEIAAYDEKAFSDWQCYKFAETPLLQVKSLN